MIPDRYQPLGMVDLIARLPADHPLRHLDDHALAHIEADWSLGSIARRNQRAPLGTGFSTWVACGGRGSGKTRLGAETTNSWAMSGQHQRGIIVAPTFNAALDVCIGGESGILACAPRWQRPVLNQARHTLAYPNGCIVTFASAQDPDALRGQNATFAWCDELAYFPDPGAMWKQVRLVTRIGKRQRRLVTTTPRNLPAVVELLTAESTFLTRASTRENVAGLSEDFIREIYADYANSALGRQELDGELLLDIDGALWPVEVFRYGDINPNDAQQIVVGVDPSGGGDEIGIVVIARMQDNAQGQPTFAVLADRSGRFPSAAAWMDAAGRAFNDYRADRIVIETNFGGQPMVESLRTHLGPHVPVDLIHSTRGKALRAEPFALAYETGRVIHTRRFPELEQQMMGMGRDGWHGQGRSPDRLDAAVFAFAAMAGSTKRPPRAVAPDMWRRSPSQPF